ncbi:MAG: sporulation protein [Lachnospiraceae bacterium]|nr:sporulation protein [Lachnospiraceae bacterium]
MAESLKMPKDLVYGDVLIQVSGRHEVYVENYKNIIEYTENSIRLQTKSGKLSISGKQLHIEYYTGEEMKITGYLSEFKYE